MYFFLDDESAVVVPSDICLWWMRDVGALNNSYVNYFESHLDYFLINGLLP
jgi:hypothetical protein